MLEILKMRLRFLRDTVVCLGSIPFVYQFNAKMKH